MKQNKEKFPKHVAIVMDGNGRWAEKRFRPRSFGHKAGVATAKKIIKHTAKQEISILTLFAFSVENWQRPQEEVNQLIDLFVNALEKEIEELQQHNVKLRFIGDISAFADKLKNRIIEVTQLTANNDGLQLNIALNYSGRWDIVQGVNKLVDDMQHGKFLSGNIDESILNSYLCLSDIDDPDLFIRTGGEKRISNFLLWQLAYTEMYFTEILWPDFSTAEMDKAFIAYAARERRFGKTSQQVNQV